MACMDLPDDIIAHIMSVVLQESGAQRFLEKSPPNYNLSCVCKRWNKILLQRNLHLHFSDATREELFFLVSACEEAENYNDMFQMVMRAAPFITGMTVKERNLLSVACSNVIGSKRASLRILQSLMQKEKSPNQIRVCTTFIETIKMELDKITSRVIRVLEHLQSTENQPETKVFLYRKQSDIYRYRAEFTEDPREAKLALECSDKCYKVATELLPATHPIRLGTALSFATFYYEILHQPQKACELAKEAFDSAIVILDTVNDDQYKDTTLILQLLRDNLTLWTSEE